MASHFRIAPEILKRLGEELVPHPDQGIIELVRNAYDANAQSCIIELYKVEVPGGRIVISDDGDGMNEQQIVSGWLVLGRSTKRPRELSRQRIAVGDKGLGRLAALRLGSAVYLFTRPVDEPGVEYRVHIDWSRFDRVNAVEDVSIDIIKLRSEKPPGTTIEISNLSGMLGYRDVQRLARSLILLADPFDMTPGFKAKLVAPEFSRLERLVKQKYFGEADLHLIADLGMDGMASARIMDWRGEVMWNADHSTINSYEEGRSSSKPFSAPATRLEVWMFLLSRKNFHSRTLMLRDLREWLNSVGGIHLYHRGLRVLPYGDPGDDWLEMNLPSRMREVYIDELPSTKNSVGRVIVWDATEALLQKTDRMGFVETKEFDEIRSFARASLAWMKDMRLQDLDARYQYRRTSLSRQIEIARRSLQAAIERAPPRNKRELAHAFKFYDKVREWELEILRDELELYRTLGTVGTTVAVFAHESGKPVTQIEQMARSIEIRGRRDFSKEYKSHLSKPVHIILESCSALKTYANTPLQLLKNNKRRIGRIDVNAVIRDSVNLFAPFVRDARVTVISELSEEKLSVNGTVASIEAIITNLITNAISALTGPGSPLKERKMLIRSERVHDSVRIRVLDNGPGIEGIKTSDVWLPGKTTRPGGTGLGLTIVRDAAIDLGGGCWAVDHGELGGAEFVISLPILESRKL